MCRNSKAYKVWQRKKHDKGQKDTKYIQLKEYHSIWNDDGESSVVDVLPTIGFGMFEVHIVVSRVNVVNYVNNVN
jgi:hypothetical protein